MDPVTLHAPTVRLRPHRSADLDGIVDQCTDPETRRWIGLPNPYTREDAERFLDRVAAGWREGTRAAFAIADPDTDEFLGTIDLDLRAGGKAEVGFGLRAAARGRGLMVTALQTLLDWAFATDGLDLAVLHWRAIVGNWASRRVVWRVGFRVEGTVRGLCGGLDGWIGSLRRTDKRTPVNRWLEVPVLHGGRGILRPFRTGDAGAVVEGCSDPVTQHWLGDLPRPYTLHHALGYIQSREEEHASGRGIYWAVADPDTDRCLGSFGLMDLHTHVGGGEVGYWMHPAARGRGMATEAVTMLARHAVIPTEDGGLGLRRLVLGAATANGASRRVAEKAGFRQTGTARAAERLGDGTFVDLARYDLLADEVTPW